MNHAGLMQTLQAEPDFMVRLDTCRTFRDEWLQGRATASPLEVAAICERIEMMEEKVADWTSDVEFSF